MIVTRVVGAEVSEDGKELLLEVARLDVDRRSPEAPKVLGKKRITVLRTTPPSAVYTAVQQAGQAIDAALVMSPEGVQEYINRRLEEAGG